MEPLKLKVSYAPFVRSKDSIESVMYNVAAALLPATLVSVFFFGWRTLLVTAVAIISSICFEWAVDKIRKKPSEYLDGSALVTGQLIALNVPSGLPLWMIIMGAFVAIVVAKHLFGGLGFNIFNPALVARVFLLISFPAAMTEWPVPFSVDMQTAASPLGILKTDGLRALADFNMLDAFYGIRAGSLGETSIVALLPGAAWLLYKKYITWHIPATFIGATMLFTGIFHLLDPLSYASPLFHLLTGGLVLGAFFMATDMVTSPLSLRGQIIFGIGCGVLTAIIRLWGGYPEGVSFAILIMNALVPLLDRWDVSEIKAKKQQSVKAA